jgi:hypothetical protein
MKNATMANT